MDQVMRQRGVMALIGAFAGICLYILSEVVAQQMLDDRLALGLAGFGATFFGAFLALTGPMPPRRAALGAIAVATIVTLLMCWASLRYSEVNQFISAPLPWITGLVLAGMPLPFLIAAAGPGWRDYPTLFTQSWTIVVRYGAAWLFVGVVWAIIFLSDSLLGIVGLGMIGDLIELEPMPWAITGLALGLALAVVSELSDLVSPDLILRLLRLLLPVVVVVMAVFIGALPFRGLSGLFGTLSAAATLLSMTVVAVTLVSTAIDQSDAEASDSTILMRATQALALILPVPAALGGYAIWLRVAQYGWTPDRVFAAVAAVLALGYGLIYAGSVLRGPGWMARIRRGNIAMALVVMLAAAVLLTPALNPERIAANSQVSRFIAGKTRPESLDLAGMQRWGHAGAKALSRLENLAKEPGQEALSAYLATATAQATGRGDDAAALRATLARVMPLQPVGAEALRDILLRSLDPAELSVWLASCRALLADGRPGCVMVVGDFQPATPGEEALVVLHDATGYSRYLGFARWGDTVIGQNVIGVQGPLRDLDSRAVIPGLQDGAPQLEPAPMNQLWLGPRAVMLIP